MNREKSIFMMMAGLCLIFILTSGAEARKKTIVLDHASWLPAVTPVNKLFPEFFKGLEEATGGAVKTKLHSASSMGPPAEHYNLVLNGLADIAHLNPGFIPGIFPMLSMFELPLHFNTAAEGSAAMHEMYKRGYFDKEFANVKVLGLLCINPYHIFWRDKKVVTVEDFKGLKVRSPGTGWSEIIKTLGGVSVSAPTSEMYMMQQKGIVDGCWGPWEMIFSFKMNEVSKFVTETYLVTVTHVWVMNKDSWQELPQEAKDFLDKNSWVLASEKGPASMDDTVAPAKKLFLKTPGAEINPLPESELDKMDELFAPIWAKWIADREAKGLPAKKALADLYDIFKGLGVKRPFIGYTPGH